LRKLIALALGPKAIGALWSAQNGMKNETHKQTEEALWSALVESFPANFTPQRWLISVFHEFPERNEYTRAQQQQQLGHNMATATAKG